MPLFGPGQGGIDKGHCDVVKWLQEQLVDGMGKISRPDPESVYGEGT